MFGVDFSEIALIFLIALVVLGPAKLPQVAATIGRWVGRARIMARQFREQLEQEANTLREATEVRPRPPSPAAPSPSPAAPSPPAAPAAPAAEAPPPVDIAPSGIVAVRAEDAASDEGMPQMDSNVRFHVAEPSAPASPAPEHLDHPAPPAAEPHERGA
jgi:sec-independent protein translocase protein TatB